MNLGCMISGNTVTVNDGKSIDPDVIVVSRGNTIIGVVSAVAQKDAETLRMTFTRNKPTTEFAPLQGVVVQQFRHELENSDDI